MQGYMNFKGHALRIAVGITMLVLLLVSGAGAVTITVNASGGADHMRIQDAVNASSNGDTIMVAAGTYNENVVVNKSVSLIGAGAEVTIVNAYNTGVNVFTITVNNVNISGFTARGATASDKAGIFLNQVKYINISNNKAFNNWAGIYLYYSDNNILIDNVANTNNTIGIYVAYSGNNILTNNIANSDYSRGIYVYSSNNNILTDNTANSNWAGLSVDSSINNILTNNTAKENYPFDLYYVVAWNVPIADMQCNNVIVNTTGSGGRPIKYFNSSTTLQNEILSELVLCNADNSIISNVTIDGSVTKKNNALYMLKTEYSSFTNIDSSNNYQGIFCDSFCNFNNLTNNVANSNLNEGINFGFSSNNVLMNNTANYNNDGLNLVYAGYNTLINNTVNSNNRAGIMLSSATINTLTNNIISNNHAYGVSISYSWAGSSNTLYNNIFNNTNNVEASQTYVNTWNTDRQSGRNVVGGPYLGGNFWANPSGTGFSQTCTDADRDGICNSSYILNSNNIDYLPLSMNFAPVSKFNISGYKINDTNGNGQVDAGEAGIPGWNITLKNATTGAVITSNLTDANGFYQFQNLANGTYNVSEEMKSGFTNVTPISIIVTINGADAHNQNFTNVPVQVVMQTSITSPSQQTFAFGTTIDFASQVAGGTSPYTYSWESSRDGIISTTLSFSISNLSMGTHTVTLTVTDANSIKATDTKVITVNGIDLSLKSSDIGFSKAWPMKDEEITLNATIANDGSDSATNVNVRFYDNEQLIGETIIPSISHHSSSIAQINYVSNISGYRFIKVVIDEANSIIEGDETNNIAIRPIAIGNGNFYGSIDLSASIQTPKYTGEYTTVSGSAIYNTTFGNGENVAGALVTITIEGTSYTTYTTSAGTFSTDIIAPYSSGQYPVSVRISDNTFIQEKSLTLTVNNWPAPLPDLVITQNNITFPQSAYVANVSGTVNARIVNIGRADASGVTISFYDDGVLFATNTIPSIPRYGGSVTTSAPITPSYSGTHSITVKVDVDNSIPETNELNNQASRNLYVYPDLPDFTPSNIYYSDSTPYDGQQVTVYAGIRNIGGIDSATSVSFYLDDILKNTVSISVAGRNGYSVASSPMTFTTVGNHQVRVIVDEAETVQESDEGNNQLTSSIYVHAPQPDLRADDIFLNISSPVSGDSVLVTGIFRNDGETSATNVVANLNISGLFVNTATIPTLAAGSSQTISWVWNPISNGYFDIQLSVDPQNAIVESNENNNLRTETFYVYPALPDPYPFSLASTPSIAEIGVPVTINAVIKNKGGISTGAMTVKLYDNDSEIFSTIITVPGKDGTAPVSTTYAFASSGTHTIKVKVDPANAIPEFDESNNERLNTIYILPQLPDIQIRSEDIYYSNNNPDIDENIVIYANVSNIGTLLANNIVVNFYVDYIFINTTSIPSISNKSFVIVNSTWIAQGEGSHVVGVEAIYGGSELSGTNNAATRGIMVGQIAIPPASVTDLHNISYASNYINWTWTDPADMDFDKVKVYLNGVYKDDVLRGIRHYNASVAPGTYTIGTRTVDTDGNINATMVTNTSTTILPIVRFINGTVKDSVNKTVISGVTVSTTNLSTKTNSSGFYSFAVTSGTYNLTAKFEPAYYVNNTIMVSTVLSAVVVQDIELLKKPTGNITGSVTKV